MALLGANLKANTMLTLGSSRFITFVELNKWAVQIGKRSAAGNGYERVCTRWP